MVLGPVHFAHACVEYGKDIGGAALLAAGQRHGVEGHDGHNGQVRAVREALGHAAGGAHAGKRAGTGAKGDRIAVGQRNARLGQQFLYHRQNGL